MNARISTVVSRMLVMVMALTFLSPVLGAQRVTDHELAHAATTAHAAAADSTPAHAHDNDADNDGDGDHNEAHSLIGHLLLHMPFFSAGIIQITFPRLMSGEKIPTLLPLPTLGIPELPFKPPRASFV